MTGADLMRYFTDLEVEVDGRIEGRYLYIYNKQYKITRGDAKGIYAKEVQDEHTKTKQMEKLWSVA